MLAGAAIRHLRVPASAGAAARRVLERWLDGIQLQRYGLPATAVLAVRQARAPLIALSERSANDPLAAILRHAVRPAAVDFVGAATPAVWFADEAELLACLARDAIAGRLAASWWWPALLGKAPDVTVAQQRWQASARVVPQALALLAASGSDRRWVGQIGAGGRAALLSALAAQFPLCAEVRAAIAACEPAAVALQVEAPAFVEAIADEHGPAQRVAPSRLSPARADATTAFLRLTRALGTEPQRAGEAHFASFVEAPVPGLAERSADGAGAAGIAADAPPRVPAATVEPRAPLTEDRRAASPHAFPRATEAALVDTAEAASPHAIHATPSLHLEPGASVVDTSPVPARKLHRVPSPRVHSDAPSTAVDTAFGGVFFVVNVALALDLYGDFTRPLHPGLAVPPWHFLHHAARSWIGPCFAADPLAAWLLERAPATPSPPLPDRWQVNPAWLRPFVADARPWHALVDAQALQLLHPAGFVIARHAGATQADLPALLATLEAGDRSVQLHRPARPARRPRDLLAPLWPLLGARLALALGLPPRHAVRLLLALPARLRASAGRLDVHFALASLPLALRLAGLDRDPGWLPAAGCDFRFHFD